MAEMTMTPQMLRTRAKVRMFLLLGECAEAADVVVAGFGEVVSWEDGIV